MRASVGTPAVLLYPRAQGRELECLERARRIHAVTAVRDEEPAVDEMDVGLDAVEATLQRIE